MSNDYGRRGKSKMSPPTKIAVGVGVAACVAVVAYFAWASFLRDRDKNMVDAQAYAASGAPCPVATAAQLAANGPHPRHSFDFDDVKLSYAFGETDCAMVADHGGAGLAKFPICHFTSPGSLEVVAGKTEAIFLPGLGKPAAIMVHQGVISCVLTAKEKE